MGMGVVVCTAGGLMRVVGGVCTYRVPHFDEVINIDDSALQVAAGQVGLLGLLLRLLGSSNGHGLGDGRGQLLLLDLLGARHCCCGGGFGGLAALQVDLAAGWAAAGWVAERWFGGELGEGLCWCWRGGVVGQVQGAGCSWCGGGRGGVFGLML